MAKQSRRRSKMKYLYILFIVLVLTLGALFLFNRLDKKSNNLAESTQHRKIVATQSTPTAPALQTNSALTPGGVVDNNGKTTGTLPPSSDWVSSQSNTITLQQPSSNSTLTSGDTISGIASVSNVSFILGDNSVGLIDQGNLSVVNGKFSGQMNFQAHSKTGQLQVYYPNPSDGSEEDVIEINVNFGT